MEQSTAILNRVATLAARRGRAGMGGVAAPRRGNVRSPDFSISIILQRDLTCRA
jgi:hypothetical protein